LGRLMTRRGTQVNRRKERNDPRGRHNWRMQGNCEFGDISNAPCVRIGSSLRRAKQKLAKVRSGVYNFSLSEYRGPHGPAQTTDAAWPI
jgi:hypothetical protein